MEYYLSQTDKTRPVSARMISRRSRRSRRCGKARRYWTWGSGGGRLAISDIVAAAPLRREVRDNVELHVGCMAGAATIDELATTLSDVGFTQIRIEPNERSREGIAQYVPGSGLENYVVSATIEAVRP